ncbi:MAG: family 10 glycosylhydrolase, partial [Oscillospiraceae bacterium]|nr:family 10 glycosylhydrolase [Oscillospiraceae bacterium]
YNLKFHAWINPYRVSYSGGFESLADDSPAKKIYSSSPESNDLFVLEEGIFFNPCSAYANSIILAGVRELVENYDVDGVHIDDYFYPVKSAEIDFEMYSEYIENGGEMKLADWRRYNINHFIRAFYDIVKAADENILFGISPAGNISLNMNELFADVEEWANKDGYCDYIIPQLYFGFNYTPLTFIRSLYQWDKIIKNNKLKVYYGLAAYKSGKEEKGELDQAAKNEWVENTDIIARQINSIRTVKYYNGFAVFSYDSFFSKNISEIARFEFENFKFALQQ